jgi:hypothetical protein
VLALFLVCLRLIAAILGFLVCFVVSYGLVMAGMNTASTEPPPSPVVLLAVALMTVLPIAWVVLRARTRGWPLAVSAMVIFFGVQIFLPQVETLIFQAWPAFAHKVPIGIVPRLFVAGLLQAVLWVPLAVRLLGRWQPSPVAQGSSDVTLSGLGWKIALAMAAYVVLYFTFGYFVAWRSPGVASYYGGSDPGTFSRSLLNMVVETPWLPLAQALRAVVWTWLAVIVFRTMRASTIEKAAAIATVFALVMNANLLLPNPYMPGEVRMAHFFEIVPSNFLFGVFLGWLLGSHYGETGAIAASARSMSAGLNPNGPGRLL